MDNKNHQTSDKFAIETDESWEIVADPSYLNDLIRSARQDQNARKILKELRDNPIPHTMADFGPVDPTNPLFSFRFS